MSTYPYSAVIPTGHSAVTVGGGDVDLPPNTVSIYVGTEGDVTLTTLSGEEVTYPNVPAGKNIDGRFTSMIDATTTASDLVAQYVSKSHVNYSST